MARQITALFLLCEAWIVGTVDNDNFVRKSLELRGELAGYCKAAASEGARLPVVDAFNHAVRSALAVTQAIEDVQVKSWAVSPSAASRAYYFGQRVAPETILAMERTLDIG